LPARFKTKTMTKFIELHVAADEDGSETKVQLVNIASIGRVYANPQSNRKSIVELNYQSINDAPVFLEVVMPYETIRQLIAANT
jgi:hypothetical protein